MISRYTSGRFAILLFCLFHLISISISRAAEFGEVYKVLREHCFDCHSVQDPDGKLVLETHELLMKGGESGPAVIPGNSSESLLVRIVEGRFEKDGKVRFMPPGRRERLKPEEIATVRAWIDAGAQAPSEPVVAQEIVVPKIEPRTPPRRAIHSLAYEPKGKLLAVGRIGEVELHSAEGQMLVRTLEGPAGNVNAVAFSSDGKFLFAAGGDSGIRGEVRQWTVRDGKLVRTLTAHTDAIYALAVSPDGKVFATGSYDQKIKIFNASDGAESRTLSGHNGCVYSLAFRPDGKILASASGDRTVKLWDVESGERLDTLSQPLKEQYSVAFAPDGKRLAATGVDRRIRVWEVSEQARETTNPLLYSRFAHEASVLKLVFSPDGKSLASSAEDRTVKLWDAAAVEERVALETQPDWAAALVFVLDNKALAVGRLDGGLEYYDAKNGSKLPPPKPELARVEPRGFQRGVATRLKVSGKFLTNIAEVRFADERLRGKVLTDSEIEVTADPATPRGVYEFSVSGSRGTSGKLKLYVDDLPHTSGRVLTNLPVIAWGTHRQAGEEHVYEVEAAAGQTIVFDAAARTLGSKANLVLTLTDEHGRRLASNNGFDRTGDPLIAFQFNASGKYKLAVQQLVPAGSEDHYYRLAVGSFPFVTALYPPVTSEEGGKAHLIGYNLEHAESAMPLNPEAYRWRGDMKLGRSDHPVVLEGSDQILPVPVTIAGRLECESAEDWHRFAARAGQTLILEARAAAFGSPLDTKIEVRDAQRAPIVRTLLQAVRDSAVTFRGIDSATIDCRVENWEEMELNQYLYLQGEVVRLFRAPQGPDSGFNFYASNGRRKTYFDTTATAHANGEPCYIVEPHPPGAKLIPTGLPVIPIYFENDDDGERKLGSDSRLYFTAPADGEYFVRITDARGQSGDRYVYALTIREPQPGFKIRVDGMNPTVARGSGQRFVLSVDRIDGFEGEIRIDVSGVPPGFVVSNPIVIEAGHTSAFGTIFAEPDATSPEGATIKFTASASVNEQTVQVDAGSLGQIKLADEAPLYVMLEAETPVITIAPGTSVPAHLKIRRNGHDELVTFQVENLPHGIIVDNIGLNGVLISKDLNEREIFLTAAKWVPETERLCYAVANEAGRQTSRPVLVKVRHSAAAVTARK